MITDSTSEDKNLEIYNLVREVPEEATSPITTGPCSGLTAIDPMWRNKTLTSVFGPVGFGWYPEIVRVWNEAVGTEVKAFVQINLYYSRDGGTTWSKPIPGVGGSFFTRKCRDGHTQVSDDCYKMAYTDALGVSMKLLGVGADVYWGNDVSKYRSDPSEEKPENEVPKAGAVRATRPVVAAAPVHTPAPVREPEPAPEMPAIEKAPEPVPAPVVPPAPAPVPAPAVPAEAPPAAASEPDEQMEFPFATVEPAAPPIPANPAVSAAPVVPATPAVSGAASVTLKTPETREEALAFPYRYGKYKTCPTALRDVINQDHETVDWFTNRCTASNPYANQLRTAFTILGIPCCSPN